MRPECPSLLSARPIPSLIICVSFTAGNLPPEVLSRLASHHDASSAANRRRHLVANFGQAVPLGETQHMILVVTNQTPMHAAVRSWLDTFGVEDVSRLTGGVGSLTQQKPGEAGERERRCMAVKLKGVGSPLLT